MSFPHAAPHVMLATIYSPYEHWGAESLKSPSLAAFEYKNDNKKMIKKSRKGRLNDLSGIMLNLLEFNVQLYP